MLSLLKFQLVPMGSCTQAQWRKRRTKSHLQPVFNRFDHAVTVVHLAKAYVLAQTLFTPLLQLLATIDII